MKIGRILVPVLAAVLFAAGCGGSEGGTSSAPTTQMSSVSGDSSAVPVPEQLRFTAKTVDGAEFSGATLAGKRVVFWFWAPWCPICQREAAGIAAAARTHPDVQFIGVAARDQLSAMKDFVSKYDLPFTNIADTDGVVWQRFGVTAQPAFAFVSKFSDVDVVPGTLSESELSAQIAALG